MKKILTILMLFCTITAFAADVTGTYNGVLTISVDGGAPTTKQQAVLVSGDSTVKLTIPGFSYSGLSGDVVVNATRDADGNLTLKSISFAGIPMSAKFDAGSKISNNQCVLSMNINALVQKIKVTFDGVK